jgi:hypothetical protein
MGKFRIKISSSWFSEDYIVLKYSTNGIFWKTIKCYDYEISDNWCYMSTKIGHFSNAKELISKFKTIEDVRKYEEEERRRVIKHNQEISDRNKKHKEERNNVYRRYS